MTKYNGNGRLSQAQRRVLKTLVEDDRPFSPTREEIAKKLGVSKQVVQKHLQALEEKGYVTIDHRMPRGIHLTEEAEDFVL